MRRFAIGIGLAFVAVLVTPAKAAFHKFRIDQVYSNADGSVQYIVMLESTGSNLENLWSTGASLRATPTGGTARSMPFTTNLPSTETASHSVLIATPGFAALNLVTPDYMIPAGFIPVGGGTLNYSNVDQIALPALPTDGATAVDRNGSSVPATPKNFNGDMKPLMPSAPAGPDLDQHGLTGSWYEAATSGQGIELEIFPNLVGPGTALAQGAWFTFEGAPAGGADRQRWFTLVGNAQSGAASVPVTIYRNTGGNFNAAPVTNPTAVGTGSLAFSDCNNGTLDYTFSDGSGRAGSIPLTRLTMNVTCTVGSAPPTNADFALSGNWFNASTSGQGFVFDANPLSRAFFLTWYTYAPTGQAAGAAGQRWFTGLASNFTPGARTIPLTLYETTGGLFDQVTTPLPPSTAVGTGTVTFASCTNASFQFNFTGGSSTGASGTIPLTRIGPVPAGCVVAVDSSSMPPPGMCTPGPYGEGCPP